MRIIAIGLEMGYEEEMEHNTPTQMASQSAEASSAPASSKKAVRKFSTASSVEKTAVLVKWLEENKARDVVALDVAGKSPCMEVIVVVTATSLRHGKSLADGLMDQCKKNNFECLRVEGAQTGQWILADLNDIVVHIFQQDMRGLFRVESLWKDAEVLHGTVSQPACSTQEPAFEDED